MSLYTLEKLTKTYGEDGARVVALDGVTLSLPESKLIVILGASGSGKSTLLNMLGCMDSPTSGRVLFGDEDITAFSKAKMTAFRDQRIGFVFQSYNLLPDLTALENVEFSTEIKGLSRADAERALEQVGLKSRLHHFPAELSGGEQQRVSIARAIAKNPRVLLCDEPTGALDFQTGVLVLEVLWRIVRQQGTSLLLITHNQAIAQMADLVVTLRSGEILSLADNPSPRAPSEVSW